jgi:protein TonB
VKHFWLSIFLSLGVHVTLFGLDLSWLKSSLPVTPYPSRITITLVASQPLEEKKTSPLQNLSATVEKTVRTLEEETIYNQVIKQMPKQPAMQKPAPKPIIPPATALPQQMTITKESALQKKVPEKKVKPKRSLKKLTKKKQKKEYPKDIAQIKSIQAFHPKLEPDDRNLKKVALEQSASMPTTSESSKNIRHPKNTVTKSTTENRATSESTASVTTGHQSGKPARIMASPLYRKNPSPKYPRHARRKGYEGTVILEVLVDENGTVKDLKVVESSGYELLDKSAISSVQKWLFEPGTEGGKAAKMWVRVPIRFKLN